MKKLLAVGIGSMLLILFVGIIFIINFGGVSVDDLSPELKPTERVYDCDYHVISLKTHISFSKDGEDYSVTGRLLTFLTDPLTLKKSDGTVIGYASDQFHVVNQDDHSIIIDNKTELVSLGEFVLVGEEYKLFDAFGNSLGTAKFNNADTLGTLRDVNNNIYAIYDSSVFRYDYKVKIYDNAPCSDLVILMFVASYISDVQADRSNNSSSSKSANK